MTKGDSGRKRPKIDNERSESKMKVERSEDMRLDRKHPSSLTSVRFVSSVVPRSSLTSPSARERLRRRTERGSREAGTQGAGDSKNRVNKVNGCPCFRRSPVVSVLAPYSLHTRLRHVREERGGHDKRRRDGRRHVDGRNEG